MFMKYDYKRLPTTLSLPRSSREQLTKHWKIKATELMTLSSSVLPL